jgi:FtsZ-binding cell division protein ZapB
MQLENFERLEEKIRQAVELIDRLKQENQEITSSYRKLEDQITSFEMGSKGLSTEAGRLRSELARKEKNFIKKKEEIRKRLEKLLEKLIPFEAQG